MRKKMSVMIAEEEERAIKNTERLVAIMVIGGVILFIGMMFYYGTMFSY